MFLPDTTSYSEFRQNLSSHFKRLKKSRKPTLITQNGKTAAVVMSPQIYEELMSDAEESRSIARLQRSMLQARQGQGRLAKDVFADLYSRLGIKQPGKTGHSRRRSRD